MSEEVGRRARREEGQGVRSIAAVARKDGKQEGHVRQEACSAGFSADGPEGQQVAGEGEEREAWICLGREARAGVGH